MDSDGYTTVWMCLMALNYKLKNGQNGGYFMYILPQ